MKDPAARREALKYVDHGTALVQGRSSLSRSKLLAARSAGVSKFGYAEDVAQRSALPVAKLPVTSASVASRRGSCAELVNKGTHFTVQVQVGTPPQKFDVVTDTGSNALIIRSCVCQETGGCYADQGNCFTGTKKSSTFALPAKDKVNAVVLTFGSGKIEAVIASDVVKVGGATATMQDALLLMVQRQLDLSGHFEGILGLGLPTTGSNESEGAAPYESGGGGVIMKGGTAGSGVEVKGFMELSGMHSFSVCFNDGGNGVLRMDPSPAAVELGSVGRSHWGLDFRGITVNKETINAKVDICGPKEMETGQKTACGAIPDSGTTVIMAPAKHIKLLFEAICQAWPRCATTTKESGEEPHKVMQALLFQCQDWLNVPAGTNAGQALDEELPSLHLEIADHVGKLQTLILDPVDYIMETMQTQLHHLSQHMEGLTPPNLTNLMEPGGIQKKVCAPAFGVMDFDTKLNGPVWILGTPIFYKYQVGYNMSSTPPSISFIDDACGTCTNEMVLVSQENSTSSERDVRTPRNLRQVNGPLRVPNLDKSKGL